MIVILSGFHAMELVTSCHTEWLIKQYTFLEKMIQRRNWVWISSRLSLSLVKLSMKYLDLIFRSWSGSPLFIQNIFRSITNTQGKHCTYKSIHLTVSGSKNLNRCVEIFPGRVLYRCIPIGRILPCWALHYLHQIHTLRTTKEECWLHPFSLT